MPRVVAERLDPQVLEPFFTEIEPVRQDINVIRGLTLSIGEERFVRMRQATPIVKLELEGGAYTTDESRQNYRIDFLSPTGQRYLKFVTAVWHREQDDLELYPQATKLHPFRPGELKELGRPVVELFDEYDKWSNKGFYDDGNRSLRGWTSPDIHTAEGMTELATILNAEGKVVDDK